MFNRSMPGGPTARDLYLAGGYGPWQDMAAVRAHAACIVAEIEALAVRS